MDKNELRYALLGCYRDREGVYVLITGRPLDGAPLTDGEALDAARFDTTVAVLYRRRDDGSVDVAGCTYPKARSAYHYIQFPKGLRRRDFAMTTPQSVERFVTAMHRREEF